jgi:hypothetical protein
MHRLPGLLLLIVIVSVFFSGNLRLARDSVSRQHHRLLVDVFDFEAREEVA